MKTSEAFPSNYLKSDELGDRQWTLTIDDYKMEELTDRKGNKQTKPVLYFRRTKKGLVLNVTNSRTIEVVYGDEMDDWIGKDIILFSRIVETPNGEQNAIRVRVPQPGQSTAPSHHQPRPAPAQGFTSGLPGQEAKPAPRKPVAEHAPIPASEAYTEANPPLNTGQGYRGDMDDQIPFAPEWK